MNEQAHTVVLVLKNGRGFGFRDVALIVNHITGKWNSEKKLRIICLWDKASVHYKLGDLELIPLKNTWPGTWSRMVLYSPEMEQYRPFLYVDLDTIIVNSLENIFDLVKDPSKFITLEDFYQSGKLATGLVWVPANSAKVSKIWKGWERSSVKGKRMDYFLRKVLYPDAFWQQLTNTIYNFKSVPRKKLLEIPKGTNLICFHGNPRIYDAVDEIGWVREYVETRFETKIRRLVTVIIPYKKDRGWLKDAIKSVPENVQLLVSQGEGNWPQNFNKVLDQAEGEYIKYLHEDDMLTKNCIEDSVRAIEEQGADFIHGNALEFYQQTNRKVTKEPEVTYPTVEDLKRKNTIHSVTIMYRRSVFEKIGSFDETLNMCEEYEFNLRCLHNGMKIGYCPSTLGIYRRHPAQKIRTFNSVLHMEEKVMVNEKYA